MANVRRSWMQTRHSHRRWTTPTCGSTRPVPFPRPCLWMALSPVPRYVDGAPASTTSEKRAQVAAATITHSQLAAAAVGSAAVDSSQVQLRVTGTCGAGQSVATVLAGGGVTCLDGNAAFVNEGQAASVSSTMLVDQAVTSNKVVM